MPKRFEPAPRFEVLHDLKRRRTTRYDRTTVYLVDRDGVVRQVFPMLIHTRPSWAAILREVEKLERSPRPGADPDAESDGE